MKSGIIIRGGPGYANVHIFDANTGEEIHGVRSVEIYIEAGGRMTATLRGISAEVDLLVNGDDTEVIGHSPWTGKPTLPEGYRSIG